MEDITQINKLRIGVTNQLPGKLSPVFANNIEGIEYVKEQVFMPKYFRRYVIRNSINAQILETSLGIVKTQQTTKLLHTFNKTLLNKKPWVVTHESFLPRTVFPWVNKLLLEILSREECRAIISMSENAKKHILTRNESHRKLPYILEKTHVIYPGIEDYEGLDLQEVENKEVGEEITLVFIGKAFFRKGGTLAVKAFDALRNKYNLRLIVVSEMVRDTFEVKKISQTPEGDKQKWLKFMKSIGVVYYDSLPFKQVRKLFKEADIYLLPSLDDSFGYAVLEAMSAGAVPVTTGIRAFPEMITHKKDGVLLKVNIDREGRLDLNKTSFEDVEHLLIQELEILIKDKDKLREMGKNARETFKKRFAKDRFNKELEEIYSNCL